jgi:hypothetical protein
VPPRRDASPAAIDAARTAGPPVPEQRRRRRRAADPPDPGLLVLDLAGLRTPDLVVAPGQPLRGNVDMSRAVVISFTDNANLWRATHLDLPGLEYQVHIDLDARPGTADWHTQIRRFENTKCVVRPAADPVADQPGYCGRFSPGLYTMDLLVPVVDLGQKSSWHYRSETMQIVADVLQVAGWFLATAAATAALGLVGRGET